MDTTFATLDSSLRQFAEESESQEPISVIIEIASDLANVPYVTVGKKSPLPNAKGVQLNAPRHESSHSAMDDLERLLKKLKVQDPVRLDAAEYFIVEVNPDQLKQLAGSELVGKIRPNRQHYAST